MQFLVTNVLVKGYDCVLHLLMLLSLMKVLDTLFWHEILVGLI